jgi:hypothetical protein
LLPRPRQLPRFVRFLLLQPLLLLQGALEVVPLNAKIEDRLVDLVLTDRLLPVLPLLRTEIAHAVLRSSSPNDLIDDARKMTLRW